nr:AAA domain-containing protein [uncultured Brumimicrobium sp.]
MATIHKQITQWRDGLLAPNQNDVLLTLIPEKNAISIADFYKEEGIFSIEESAFLKKCLKQHQQHFKETGSPIFGIAQDKFNFEIEGKMYQMPFLLADASIQKNRFNSTFEIEQIEDFYINPLLLKVLNLEVLPENTTEAIDELQSLGLKVELENGIWAANFHPHRFVLQKELDAVLEAPQLSESLKSLFGEENENTPLEISEHFLFPADESQRLAIEKSKDNHLVIQGPPGTGKSQVIANLIGKALGSNKNALLVAEKSVALQVIYDQLKKKELHHFCVLYHHELKSKHFVRSLQNTWKYLETIPKKHVVVGQQSELLQQSLDLTLDRLRQHDLIGGISFNAFKKGFTPNEKARYLSKKPSVLEWVKDKIILKQLENNDFPIFGSWSKLKTEQNSIHSIEEAMNKALQLLQNISNNNLNCTELQKSIKLSGLVSLFYYNDQALPIDLFEEDSNKQKQFLKLFKELKTLTEKEELLKHEEAHWNKSFSLSELQEFLAAVASTTRFSLKHWRTKNKVFKYTDLNLLEAKKALENLVELNTTRRDLINTKEKLRKLDIPEEIPVLEHIHFAITRLNSVDNNEVQSLFKMSKEERLAIKNSVSIHTEISQLLRTYFNLDEKEPIQKQIQELKEVLPQLVENSARIESISNLTKYVLSKTQSLKEAEEVIYNSHWKDFKGRFPSLAEINGSVLSSKIEECITTFDKESEEFSLSIAQQIKTKFEEYHTLLQTPANKLSQEEKALKKNLRKGKSILVKAFEKKRVFPSVRELLESEAKLWIQLLHPVFLCSPYSVAKSLPIDFSFDLAVFDEASQIPLSHIVGSVQRSKRIVISGDQQQMAPQFYFQKKDHQQADALHHASFYWENSLLTHHYRSVHPRLIAFSNQYFYENKLKTFPTVNPQNPIELITTDGVFNERSNEKEARIVAEIVIEKIKNKAFDFGLVAFSQTQLSSILEKIPTKYLDQLADKDAVFIQSLENVQGDQCEHLIISLGYAKNENGDFHMRFGPLNQEQGHRRLNVLMSRAIAKITFVRSVTSDDFAISANEGVESLRKLMLFLEEEHDEALENSLPVGIRQKGLQLEVSDVSKTFQSGQAVIDFYRTTVSRGWKVGFVV